MLKLLDAVPVAIPFKDVMEAVGQGTVDCAENNMLSYESTVSTAMDTTTRHGAQFAQVKDFAPMVRRMSPLYKKYMDDPANRAELLSILSD